MHYEIYLFRAMNVWIKFIPFIMAFRKEVFLKYSGLQGNTLIVLECLGEGLILRSKLRICDGCLIVRTL